jgi:hypothetical protein
VEYVLIVSFALLVGFCLGVLVMMLLELPEATGSPSRIRVGVHGTGPSQR